MQTSDNIHHAPVLAAYSPGTGAQEPVEFGVAASRITGAPLVIVVVADTGAKVVRFRGDEDAAATTGISEPAHHLELELQRRGVAAEVRTFEDSTAARGLARAMDECEPELVVVGSTTRGSHGATLLGTTAERVIHAASCPVAVVPNGYERPEAGVAVMGVAYTVSPEGEDALRAAASLARSGGVKLRVIAVIDPKHAKEEAYALLAETHQEVGEEAHTAARIRLSIEASARALLAEVGADLDAEVNVMVDEPDEALAATTHHIDLLVMGSRALGPHKAVVLGSVSRKVIGKAACPVLVIPRGSEAKRDELLKDAAERAPH